MARRPGMTRVSIKDVAKRANVSPAAVSYALNNMGGVSKETADRVLDAAKELNYRPNFAARSLKTQRTKTIGVVVEDVTIFNAPDIIDGINQEAENQGYSIILTNLRLSKRIGLDFTEALAYRELVRQKLEEMYFKPVEGIIYVGMHSRDVSSLVEMGPLPIVYAYCTSSREDDMSVTYDDRLTAYRACRYLLEQGHRSIGFITGPRGHIQTSSDRLEGARDALVEYGLTVPPNHITEGDWEYRSGLEGARQLLGQAKITAIFALNDLMALGAMAFCQEHNLAVPNRISVIGFDNRESSRYFVPELSTMALPLRTMGEQAAQMLIRTINHEGVGDRVIRMPGELKIRNSVMPPSR